jgi:acetyl-CoA synthetase
VLILVPRTPDWQVAMSACLHLGLVPVPCVTQASVSEVRYRIEVSGASAAIAHESLRAKVEGAGIPVFPPEADARLAEESPPPATMPADAPALLYFTSGSSGLPRAALHAARGVFVRGSQPWRQLGMGEGDVIWTSSDTGWTRAASCLLFGAWMNGATALMVETPPDPAERLELLERFGVSIFGAVTTELRLIIASGRSRALPRLRWTLSAGEAMTAEMAERWEAFSGVPMLVGYGQSETPTATLTDPDAPPVNGMIGRPMAGNDVRIVDDAGVECAAGVQGNLAFSAQDPGLMLGYFDRGSVRLDLLAGRWHLTGDCGYRDAQGNLYFVGRNDDIISSAGYRIGPTEVENALTLHPAVAECAVVASPDPVRGEAVKAFVVLREGEAAGPPLAALLQEHVKRQVAPYKYPRKIEFVSTLPRTPSGKISRRLLRDAEFARATLALKHPEV